MAIKDYTARVAPALQPLLGEGERLLSVSPLVKDPGATEDVSVTEELKNLLTPAVMLELGAVAGTVVQRAVFGRAVTGAADSIARRLFDAVEQVSAPCVTVTDNRLLIVEITAVPRGGGVWQRWFGPVEMVARGVHAVPRTAILGAVAAPAGVLRRGRFLVGFTDGSGCVLVCTPPSLAGAVIDGIGPPRSDADVPGEEHG